MTRVVPLTNVAARDLAPLLRQLNDNAGAGSVVHYEPSNVLLMTGRAAVIKRLLTIVERVDNAGDRSVVTGPAILGLRRRRSQTGHRAKQRHQ